MKKWIVLLTVLLVSPLWGQVKAGIDVLFDEGHAQTLLHGKRVGLITNQTAIDAEGQTTFERLKAYKGCRLVALFTPEHGLDGAAYAYESVQDNLCGGVPVYSLHGEHKRPTLEQLKGIDVLLFDMQDIGSRSYTYNGTLCYCIEEAAKAHIPFIVLDRPNPQGGLVVDGPLLDEGRRSFLGYVNVPYCHGMTLGELAMFFNAEYKIGCKLHVIPMDGWKREMTFAQTGLCWVPTSPQIPEADTAFFYPTTGILGQYALVSIGIGYTLPFKVVGAPWIDAERFARACNEQKLPGVHFQPFSFRPFFGRYKNEMCHGILIMLTDHNAYLPVTTGYTIAGVIKSLYPSQFDEAIKKLCAVQSKKETCHKLNGRAEVLEVLQREKYVIWKLRELCRKDCEQFQATRKKYLIPAYEALPAFEKAAF